MTSDDVDYVKSVHEDTCHILLTRDGHGIGMGNGEIAWVHGPLKDFLESVR